MSLASNQPSPDNTHNISIPLGIFIGLLASFVQSLGLTIQRKSHVINQSLPEHNQRVEHKRPLWLLGFTIFILSNLIGSLVQIASLPVVILAPLGAVSLLWNAFFARLILGDIFSPWMVIGTILIAGGAVLIGIFGIVPEPTHSLEDLLRLFRRPTFAVYFSLLGTVVFVCLVATHIGEYSWVRRISKTIESNSSPTPTATECGIDRPSTPESNNAANDDSTLTERAPLLIKKKGHSHSVSSSTCSLAGHIDRTPILLAISYASISGIISGMCLIFAKSGVELLLLTIGGENQFRHWESWVLVLGLIVFALLQLWYLHKALIFANPTLVCPSAFCFYNISSIVNGLVYFNQLQLIEPFHLCLVGFGIIVLLSGVWVVSIQSDGGGGVDVGTWSEEEGVGDDDLGVSVSVLEGGDILPTEAWCHESVHDRPVSPILNQITTFGPMALEREAGSRPGLPGLLTSPNISSLEFGTSSSHSSLPPPHPGVPQSPNAFRTRFARRRTTVGADNQRFSMSLHQRNASHPSTSFTPQLNDTMSTLGTGLQIGLSPVSPGFMIVPRERRRRLNSLGSSDAGQGLWSHERRAVSDSNVRASSELHDGPGPSSHTGDADIGLPPGNPVKGQGSKRWRWLSKTFFRHS